MEIIPWNSSKHLVALKCQQQKIVINGCNGQDSIMKMTLVTDPPIQFSDHASDQLPNLKAKQQ